MNNNTILIMFGWLIAIILLVLFVPRNKIREAQVSFLFMQVLTWIFGLVVVELKLIEYPVRTFSYATRTCFDFEYFIYPIFSILFNLYYPEKKNYFSKFMYYFYYCTALTGIEVIVERYTDIVEYINWSWYISWISLFITFYLSQKYYVWFFRLRKKGSIF